VGAAQGPSRLLKLMAITTGLDEPASRFRVRNLIVPLREINVECKEVIPAVPAYPPLSNLIRPAWLLAAIAARIPPAVLSYTSDVVLFQRELISTLSTLEWAFKSPRILDVDDAIYLLQRGRSLERVAAWCDMIICGNPFLAEKFSKWNKNIRILPTGVDTNRYSPSSTPKPNLPVIGWIGTSSNLRYLYSVEPALKRVLKECPDAVLKIVSDRPPQFNDIPERQIKYVKWSPDTDVMMIRSFSVGLMPLDDTEWARGKCSFKLLQYYACGIPAIASPIGMNADVLKSATAGFAATTDGDWADSLMTLINNPNEGIKRGLAGRRLVEEKYSLPVIAARLNYFVRELCSG
jgi:glycosyltransferase involved in cell wall biosynthesis